MASTGLEYMQTCQADIAMEAYQIRSPPTICSIYQQVKNNI